MVQENNCHNACSTFLRGQLLIGVAVIFFIAAVSASAAVAQAAQFDYAIYAYGPRTVTRGSSLYIGISGKLLSGISPNYITITAENLPAEVQAAFPDLARFCCRNADGSYSAYSLDFNTVLELNTSQKTPVGMYTITIKANTSGAVRQTSVTINVTSPALLSVSQAPVPIQDAVPNLAKWEENMKNYGTQYCNKTSAEWYYDGERVYFQIANYTKDPFWLTCADIDEKLYRDEYVFPNNGAAGWAIFPHGLLIDYKRSSDNASRDAVLLLAENASYAPDVTPLAWVIDQGASREVAYNIMAYLSAEELGAPHRKRLDQFVDIALGHLDQWFVTKNAAYIRPFMAGLTMEALIQYYEKTKDPRIPPAIKNALDRLWEDMWLENSGAFKYTNIETNTGGTGPAPDLNLLIAPAYGWMYSKTGNATYVTRGDAIFSGGVKGAWLGAGKQFNQNYRWSFDYLKWRNETPISAVSTTDTAPPIIFLIEPTNGTKVSGVVTVSANASDNMGVVAVQFEIDNASHNANSTTVPYFITWDTKNVSDGAHNITAVALDAAGNTATDNAIVIVNNTLPAGSVGHIKISNVNVPIVSPTTATISWATDRMSSHQLEYGQTAAYGYKTAESALLMTVHAETLASLAPGTLYHYRLILKDASGNVSVSEDFTFTTGRIAESSGGGGSSGSGGSGESSSGGSAARSIHTFTQIKPDVPAVRKLLHQEISLKEISVEVSSPASNVQITVVKLSGKPTSIRETISEPVFQYLEINATNIEKDQVKESKLTFEVAKSWLAQNGFAAADVVLQRHTGSYWEKLPTEKVSEDSTTIKYQATAAGFSVFAVTAEKPAEAPVASNETQPAPIQNQTIPQPVQNQTQPVQPAQPTRGIALDTMLIAFVAIIVVITWLVFYPIRKNRYRTAQINSSF